MMWWREGERVARRGDVSGLKGMVNRRLVFWRSAGVAVLLFQMDENFANDFVLGDEGNHVERASALTLQRIDLIDPFDELRPTFSESGALFW